MAGHLPKAEAAPACAGPPPVILSFILCIFPLLQRLLDQAKDESLLCQLLAGLLPGIFLLILARITREAVGYGDGLILLFIGLSLGFWECIGIFFAGLLGIFLAAVLALLLFGRKKSLEIPFIPFLLTGLAGGYFWMKGYS